MARRASLSSKNAKLDGDVKDKPIKTTAAKAAVELCRKLKRFNCCISILFLNKFKSIDPDYFAVLKRLGNLITGEPVMYWNFKQGLGFQVPDDKLK